MIKHYDLKPTDKGWKLSGDLAAPIEVYKDKEEAVDEARRIASAENGTVTVYQEDGTVEEEWNYPADPAGSSS